MSKAIYLLFIFATAPPSPVWAREELTNGGPLYIGEDFLVYLDKINVTVSHEGEALTTFSYLKGSVEKSIVNETDILLFAFNTSTSDKLTLEGFSLKMEIKRRGGYYKVQRMKAEMNIMDGSKGSMTVNENLTSAVELLFPVSTSFHCSKFGPMRAPIKSKNNYTATVVFYKFQVQLEGNGTRFFPAYECVGFFTPGIWMGIFMNLILLAIITWGIYMIMSVKTMDRFDDPKGKPISFGGTE